MTKKQPNITKQARWGLLKVAGVTDDRLRQIYNRYLNFLQSQEAEVSFEPINKFFDSGMIPNSDYTGVTIKAVDEAAAPRAEDLQELHTNFPATKYIDPTNMATLLKIHEITEAIEALRYPKELNRAIGSHISPSVLFQEEDVARFIGDPYIKKYVDDVRANEWAWSILDTSHFPRDVRNMLYERIKPFSLDPGQQKAFSRLYNAAGIPKYLSWHRGLMDPYGKRGGFPLPSRNLEGYKNLVTTHLGEDAIPTMMQQLKRNSFLRNLGAPVYQSDHAFDQIYLDYMREALAKADIISLALGNSEGGIPKLLKEYGRLAIEHGGLDSDYVTAIIRDMGKAPRNTTGSFLDRGIRNLLSKEEWNNILPENLDLWAPFIKDVVAQTQPILMRLPLNISAPEVPQRITDYLQNIIK